LPVPNETRRSFEIVKQPQLVSNWNIAISSCSITIRTHAPMCRVFFSAYFVCHMASSVFNTYSKPMSRRWNWRRADGIRKEVITHCSACATLIIFCLWSLLIQFDKNGLFNGSFDLPVTWRLSRLPRKFIIPLMTEMGSGDLQSHPPNASTVSQAISRKQPIFESHSNALNLQSVLLY
jgi:hypothetical protein